ncbi:MAG: DUF3638 domain-containing protein, partial [Puniceicoccales bacterium]|nr:DUF3638 domain-containing protein [Puniceicoccales bacterium]
MGKDINSMEVIKKANLLYRSFAIYTRVRLLEDFLILHKDPSFIPTRDSLDLMRRGLGRIGRYIKRYEHNIKQNNGGRQVAEKLLSKCKSVVDEANKYLNSPDAIEVMRRASVHPSLSVKYPAIQPDGAKNIAKIFANPPGPIPNAIPVPEPSHAPRIDELSLCKKIVKLSTWTAENLQRNFSFMTTQTRSLEIMSSVTELFRLIPLPGGNEWESFVSELSQQEKISFVQNISEIMGFFRTDQTMASIMKNSEVNSIKSQLIDTDLWIPRHVIAPIANVIAKSRIIAFELLMMAADGIGENSDIREICVDNTWFVYFCGSGMNYLLQSEDMEEQKKLMEFILRNENKKRAFNSTGNYVGDTPCPHTIIDIETVSPTVEFCDALAKVSDESYIKQLTNSVTGLIAYNAHVDKDNILSRINLHKGLLLFDNLQISDCSPQEGIFSYVFSSAQLEAQNEQQKTGISSEKFIKFWLIYKCLGIVSDKNETKIILDNDCRETVSVRLPMNALEQFGGGYAGLSENQSYFESTRKQRLDGNSVEDRRTIDAIGIELSNPPTQTLGLLKLLETNDDIGNNFCPSKISIVPNDDTGNNFCPSKISIVPNLLFSALSRPVTTKADHGVDITGLNEDEKKIFEKCVDRVKEYIFTDIRDTAARSWAASDAYSVDTMEFPLLNDAKNRPNVLLDATDKLYAKVKADASENVLGSSRINRLCSVIHAMYIIDKAIIDNANDAVLSAIESRSKRILDDIKKMHEYGDGKNSPISEANTLLRFAENECIATLIAVKQKKNANNSLVGDGVDVQLVVKLYENSAILRSSHICEKMPQGCYDVIYNLTPSLTKYWKVTRTDYIGDVAKQICYALSPGSESLLEDTECTYSDGIVFLKNQSGHQVACVDLVGATANINGNYIEQCSECPYVPDFPRLFKPSREVFRVFTKIGNTWNFDDAKYGKVSIVCSPVSIPTSIPALIPASINPPLNQIYRSFENETDQQWVYIPISNTAVYLQMHGQTNYDRLCLPRCFSSEDFTVWGSPDGKLRICSFSDPSKILYETDEKGNLCDVERRKKGITPNNILFFPNQENVNSFFPNQANFNPFFPNQENVNPFFTNQANFNPFFTNQANDDLSTSFEGHGNVLFYHDGNGEVSEVVFPRYVERDGTTLSLIKKGDHFVLKSDQKYKLVDGPSLKIKPLTDNDPVQQSLLFGYQNAMCFENTDPENAGVFKYLLPDMKIDRVAGLTHEIHSILYENSQKKEILGQARCGEVTVYSNDLDFVEPSICPTNMLGALRLAHIFQTQGEYASALNVLNNIPAKATLSDDEIEGFKRILYWFDPNIGHEQNGLAALVILKATSQILQISPFNEKIKGILSEDGEGSGNRESPFFEVLQKYFSDFDLYSQTMQMDPAEEMALLVNVEILFKSKDKSKGNTLVSRMISNRINHLTKLIEQGAIEFVNTKQIESPNPFYDVERATNADIRAFCKENDQLVMSAGKLRALNDSTIVSQHVGSVYTWRNEKVRDLLNKIDTKILEPNVFSYKKKLDTESSNVASESKKQMPLTDKENKQFGDAFRKFRSEIDEEIDKGAALFELEEENNGIPAPNIEDARKLLSEVNAVKNTTTKSVKLALENLEQTLEKGRIEWSRGSDAWDKWQLPDVLRLYGIYVSNGENGLKLALEHLLTNYPWVEAESIDSILENVETYLVGTNSIRNCKNISEGLEKLCKQDTSEDVRNANWRSIVPLFRGDHSNTLASSEISREIKGNVLLFTYMSGLFPRHDQIQKIKFIAEKITSSPEKCGVLIQQVMGSGKTKVLLPFLISMLMNRRNNLPMIVSHISQMPSVVSELHSILSRIGIKLVQISTDYDSKSLNSQTLRTLRNNLESSKKNRNPVYVISSSTLLAIRTAFRSRWDNEVPRNSNDNGEFASVVCEFTKLFKFLRENVTALMDEVHITLNPKEAFIVQPPCSDAAKAKIPQHEVNFITKFIYGLPENLINAMKENTQDQISSEVLTDTLERHVAEKCGDLLLIPEKIRSEFAKFVCGRFDESDTTSTDEQSGQKSTMSDELKNYIGTLNGNTKSLVSLLHKLISSVIVQCFSKAYGEQYGYNKEGEIVVFRNHLPTESFFQDPYVTLVTYLTATLFKGVPDVLLSEWVKLQADSAKSLVANGIQIDKTEASKRFEKFFGNSGKKLSDVIGNINAEIPEMKQFLSKNLENGMKVALEFANKYSSYVDRSHATTPIDIADIFHNTIE